MFNSTRKQNQHISRVIQKVAILLLSITARPFSFVRTPHLYDDLSNLQKKFRDWTNIFTVVQYLWGLAICKNVTCQRDCKNYSFTKKGDSKRCALFICG